MLQNFKSLWSKLCALAVHCYEWLVASWRRIFGLKTPHKSLRLTRRRDAVRPLVMPGYIAFTREVLGVIKKYKKALFSLLLVYIIVFGILVGVGSQEVYASLVSLFKESAGGVFNGVSGSLWQAGILLASIASSGLSSGITPVQQVFSALLFIMLWLSTVWILRNNLAGKKVSMRDGLYSSGSPLFASIVVMLLIAFQLVPVGFVLMGYSAALATGVLAGGVEAMLFWVAAGLLSVLSIYWILSSVFALIVITIPGTYPLWAMHVSSGMVSGRRVPILLRMVWLGLTVSLTWIIVLFTVILIDAGLKSILPVIEWLPLVPLSVLLLTAWSSLWCCVYMYLLYRKVVDNESKR